LKNQAIRQLEKLLEMVQTHRSLNAAHSFCVQHLGFISFCVLINPTVKQALVKNLPEF